MLVQPVVVPDGTPIKEEISVAVRSIHVGRAGRPSGMQSEHMKMWLIDATREKNTDKAHRNYQLNTRRSSDLVFS